MKKFSSGIFFLILSMLCNVCNAQNVWTQHNDQARTGWNPFETTLNTSNVNKNTFGINFIHTVDDKIVGQPLVIQNVNIPGTGIKNIVLVTTLYNSVYAFDADENADPYWTVNYSQKTAFPNPDCTSCRPARASEIHPDLCGGNYGDFKGNNAIPVDPVGTGNMGIVGTPVVDTLSGTMYFVTKVVNPNDPGYQNPAWKGGVHDEYKAYPSNGFHQYLHAIDISSGQERPNSPVEIAPSKPGTGDGQTSIGIITFNPRTQFNRAGLVLSNGKVYVAFAAHCDNNPSHGWIVSYDESSLAMIDSYMTTPNDGRGGIWMSGTAPALDASGNLYFTAGNSLMEDVLSDTGRIHLYTPDATNPANRGESVVKLAPDLTLSSYFTPYNFVALNDADKDFGTQVMLIPGTNLAMTGCKDGNIYIMNQNSLGGYNGVGTTNNVVQTVPIAAGATFHSSFAYFGGATIPFVYQYSESSLLTSFQVSGTGLINKIINTVIHGPSGGSGGYLSVSSNGSDPSTGILWAYQAQNGCDANNTDCHGVLNAVNASNITKGLWSSDDTIPSDAINIFNKFTCPTITRGKVYVPANLNQLNVYGLKTNSTCITNVAYNKTAVASSGQGGAFQAVDSMMNTFWASAYNVDTSWIYIDLGSGFNICRIGINWLPTAAGQNFLLQVSDDAVNWATIDSIVDNTQAYVEFNGSAAGRYVRMFGTAKINPSNAWGLDEFQIFGSPGSVCRAPIGLTASSSSPSTEHLDWGSVAGAGQYIVKYKPYNSQGWLVRTTTTSSLDLSALTCGVIYYDSIQTVCGGIPGPQNSGSFIPDGCPANSCDLLPTRYYNVDLGDIGVAGSTCLNGTVYSIAGSGTDIGTNTDQFQFAYTSENTGDYEATGRVIQQDASDPFSKTGIMVRDSLTTNSRFAYMALQGNNIIFEYRNAINGSATTILGSGTFTLPFWLKVLKSGTTYSGYTSADGISWKKIGSQDLHFGNSIPAFYGMAVTSVNNTELAVGKIDNFSFDLGSSPLPIQLVSFTAKSINNDHVLISWTTSMEHLTDHYEIQRSTDNSGFETIANVAAAGESQTMRYYSTTDSKPAIGINYYRLKEIDKDGHFYISPVVTVNFNGPQGFEIYPNPAIGITNISSLRDAILQVKIFDATGKLIQMLNGDGVQKTSQLNVSGLSKGIYFVEVKTTSNIYRQKLFKE